MNPHNIREGERDFNGKEKLRDQKSEIGGRKKTGEPRAGAYSSPV